mmetsp:Transcript_13854/g.29968  ORF Transcript_13854/g.29968 Transcript_13854/m.29968 type:complete len:133 (+) Transcript_13854:155-553(+)
MRVGGLGSDRRRQFDLLDSLKRWLGLRSRNRLPGASAEHQTPARSRSRVHESVKGAPGMNSLTKGTEMEIVRLLKDSLLHSQLNFDISRSEQFAVHDLESFLTVVNLDRERESERERERDRTPCSHHCLCCS